MARIGGLGGVRRASFVFQGCMKEILKNYDCNSRVTVSFVALGFVECYFYVVPLLILPDYPKNAPF